MAIPTSIPEEDDRSMELSSIAAIYPEIRIDERYPFRASLDIPVAPSVPIHVRFEQGSEPFQAPMTPPTSLDTNGTGGKVDIFNLNNANVAENVHDDVHAISHLPPVTLDIELPLGYPAEKPPIFNISTNPQWLSPRQLATLKEDGKRLWLEAGKDMVVYTYIDHIQQMTDDVFGIARDHGDEIKLPRGLKIALLDFDMKAKREKFEQETFECGVCLEPKKGVNCHRMLLCSHVFCIPCLQDFYNTCITEGDVDSVKCMAPDCGRDINPTHDAVQEPEDAASRKRKRRKKDRLISPSELLQVPLEQETVQRYVFLKRKKKLESDKSTVYCPRQWCQGVAQSKKHPKPVNPMADDFDDSADEDDAAVEFDPLGEESQLPPMADRVAVCEDCLYAFCCVCKKGWHGELARCSPRREAELTAEEKATEEYLKLYTTQCPTCKTPCQKKMGCNHMICFQCGTHFCYLCTAWLAEDNPYKHFNTLDSSCYNRLWDLEGGDGIDPDGAEELHRLPEDVADFDSEPEPEDDNLQDDPDDGHDQPVWEFSPDNSDSDSDDEDGLGRRRPPPPAPVPPRVIPVAGNPDGEPGFNPRGLDAAGRAVAAERQAQALAMAQIRDRRGAREAFPRPPVRPGAGLQPRRHAPGNNQPVRQEGLQRFLELVQNDQEDEWDSDELNE